MPETSQEKFIITPEIRKNRPEYAQILEEHNARIALEQAELKKTLEVRAQVQAEYAQQIRKTIDSSKFAWKENIQVILDKNDKAIIYLEISQARLRIDLHYNETYESTDSLRQNSPILPQISITGVAEQIPYTLVGLSIEKAAQIWATLLKHIERKQNPRDFWYEEVDYYYKSTGTEEWILVLGKLKSGEKKRMEFFEWLRIEERRVIFMYISHLFWERINPSIFEAPKKPPSESPEIKA